MGWNDGVWTSLKWRLQVLKCCAFLLAMSFLDLRDLWFKLTWVGPYDSFAFNAGSRGSLLPAPLPVDLAALAAMSQQEFASGWPSFLSRCEALTPFCSPGSTFFLNALGSNCHVGVLNETRTIARLPMTSNARADAMAWGACQLLFDHRKPAVCQQRIASGFLARYHMRAAAVPREWLALENSAAEAELLRFLDLIARSYPKHKVVCTGGFEYQEPGRYYPTIFGCASPNLFRAEFVGVYATNIDRFAFDKAWLTAISVVSVVGIDYRIRQNTVNYFDMSEELVASASNGTLAITETTSNNFVSRGLLYVLMIVIDILLLLAQMYTGLELVTEWILPVMRRKDAQQLEAEERERLDNNASLRPTDASFTKEEYTSSLSTSLYRHPVVVLLTVVSQVISWGIIIPNSVIWTWSLSKSAKLQAYLGSLRLWTLILIGVNAIWDVVVLCFEKRAYAFARATYVTPFEIAGIGAICAYSKSASIMAISESKFAVEHQRLNDVVSFPGYVAHANTFNEYLDDAPNSQAHLLRVMYMPLLEIVLWSIFGVFLWLLVKFVGYYIWELPVVIRWTLVLKKIIKAKQTTAAVSGTQAHASRAQLTNSAYIKDPLGSEYRRESLEKLLGIPMRARSLVRATWSMQKSVNGEVIIRPPVHLDFGVLIRDRVVTARSGFASTMRSKLRLPPPPAPHDARILTTASVSDADSVDFGELKRDPTSLVKKTPANGKATVCAVGE